MTPASTPPRDGMTTPATHLTLDISGMTCAACSARVEKVLARVPGVASAAVNLPLERADLEIAAVVKVEDLIAAVDRAGYGATVRPVAPAARAAADAAIQARTDDAAQQTLGIFLLSALLTLPFWIAMGLMVVGIDWTLGPATQLILASMIQFGAGGRFYVGAFKALRGGSANMDVLVALGTSAAYFYSVFLLYDPMLHMVPHLYFEASASVVTLVLAGKVLESRAKSGTTHAVKSLMKLRPETATKLIDGVHYSVPVEALKAGDRVLVRPGERVPVDGILTDGQSEIDESLITGESIPVAKSIGANVLTGTLNGEGALTLNVTATGEDTTLARVSTLVERTLTGKAPVQRLVDEIASVFVPVVIGFSLLTLGLWWMINGDLNHAVGAAISVLVIACPCA